MSFHLESSAALDDLRGEIVAQDENRRTKLPVRRQLNPETMFAIRRLKAKVQPLTGTVGKRQRRILRLVIRFLTMDSATQPGLLFDALILLQDEAVNAVELQHVILDERYRTGRDVVAQYRYLQCGYDTTEVYE